MYNSWKVNSFNRHNVTNCFTYAGDLAGSSSLEKAMPTYCSIHTPRLYLYVPPGTSLLCDDVRIQRLAHLHCLGRVGSLRHLLCQFHGQSRKSARLEDFFLLPVGVVQFFVANLALALTLANLASKLERV